MVSIAPALPKNKAMARRIERQRRLQLLTQQQQLQDRCAACQHDCTDACEFVEKMRRIGQELQKMATEKRFQVCQKVKEEVHESGLTIELYEKLEAQYETHEAMAEALEVTVKYIDKWYLINVSSREFYSRMTLEIFYELSGQMAQKKIADIVGMSAKQLSSWKLAHEPLLRDYVPERSKFKRFDAFTQVTGNVDVNEYMHWVRAQRKEFVRAKRSGWCKRALKNMSEFDVFLRDTIPAVEIAAPVAKIVKVVKMPLPKVRYEQLALELVF